MLQPLRTMARRLFNKQQRAQIRSILFILRSIPRLLCDVALLAWAGTPARKSLREFQREMKIERRHRRSIKQVPQLLIEGKPVRLDLGGGSTARRGWTCVDAYADASGLQLDLRQPLPFPDGSVDAIYSSHTFEHFSFPEHLGQLFRECFRVLKVGGEMQLAVPDFGRALRSYAAGHAAFYRDKFWGNPTPNWCRTPIDHLNWLVYMGGQHRHMYDDENLIARMAEAGFTSVELRDFDAEQDNPLRGHQSLFVRGTKASANPFAIPQGELCKDNDAAAYDALWGNVQYMHRYVEGNRLDLWWAVALRTGVPSGKLLDIGCGGGHLLEMLHRHLDWPQQDLHGIDYSPEGVTHTRKLLPEATILQCDATQVPFGSEFTVITCIETMEHVEAPDRVLAEAYRLLNPGGKLILSVPNGDKDDYEGHVNFWNLDQFGRFCAAYPVSELTSINQDTILICEILKPVG